MCCTMSLNASDQTKRKRIAESTHIPNRLRARSVRVRKRSMNENPNEKKVVFWRVIGSLKSVLELNTRESDRHLDTGIEYSVTIRFKIIEPGKERRMSCGLSVVERTV